MDGFVTLPPIKLIESIIEPKIDQSIEENSAVIVKQGSLYFPYVSDMSNGYTPGTPKYIYQGIVDHVKGTVYGKAISLTYGKSYELWHDNGLPDRANRTITLNVLSTGVIVGVNGPSGYSLGPYTVEYTLTIYKFES